MYNRLSWKLKTGWREDFKKESCAYCFFTCPEDLCAERDYFCDNFLPNEQEFLMAKKISELTVPQLMWRIVWWIVKVSVLLFILWIALIVLLA